MKTVLLIALSILLVSCSFETEIAPIVFRSDNHIAYNPSPACAGQEVTVTFDNGYGNNCGVSRIQQFITGTWITVMEDVPQNGIITYSFTPHTAGSYRFRVSWNKSGKDCMGDNIRPLEEDPLEVVEDCCRNYFSVTSICDAEKYCPFGVEIHFMTTIENWISITGKLPEGYSFCGLYDEYGTIIQEYSGNVMEIIGDFYPCYDVTFYIYFTAPVDDPVFGVWTVMDMHETLYQVVATGCEGGV